jgi:hypothetical protein
MVRFGNTVMIHDGSALEGAVGIAYDVKPERVLVLLDREVLWPVDPQLLEVIAGGATGSASQGAP